MAKSNRLIRKINRAFLLQAGLISVTAILSILIANKVIDEILIKNAIQQESDYFWKNYQRNNQFNLPDTMNLTGYLNKHDINNIDIAKIPQQPGFYEFAKKDITLVLYISMQQNQTLYLIYNRGQVDALAAFYGLFPLSVVLIVLYLATWVTYRYSRRTLSPVIRLAEQENKINFNSIDLSLLKQNPIDIDSGDDIQVLFDAILHLGERLKSYVARERNFTRDASHELRSPLTVINIAADMLLEEPTISIIAKKNLHRIKRAIVDMEELTEAFLLLARETDSALTKEQVCINDVLREEIERSTLLKKNKDISINLLLNNKLYTQASDKVLSVLFGNLIRNAILYTDQGQVDISIDKQSVIISDSGQGIEQHKVKEIFEPFVRGKNNNSHGHGVGLTIVKRLSDRFKWPIRIDSSPQQGTTVVVEFPVSKME